MSLVKFKKKIKVKCIICKNDTERAYNKSNAVCFTCKKERAKRVALKRKESLKGKV